jgi:hypothetical protein
MNFMPDEKFVLLCQRWVDSRNRMKGDPKHDQGIMEGLFDINNISGLVSIWSCEGHPDRAKGRTPVGYIMLGVRNQAGLDALFAIYERLRDSMGSNQHHVKLTATSRVDGTVSMGEAEEEQWWPVWILNWPVFKEGREEYLQKVNNAIKGVI